MAKPIKGKDGKFAGSIGEGKAKVPTAAPAVDETKEAIAAEQSYAHLDRMAKAFKNTAEPSPITDQTYTVTHPHGPAATITHTQWSDGHHTVTARWIGADGKPEAETLVDSDDRPDISQAISDWRDRQTSPD